MKYIICGQLLAWVNVASIITGYIIFKSLNIDSEYVQYVLGGIGIISAIANMVFAIILQVHGYEKLKIIVPYQPYQPIK